MNQEHTMDAPEQCLLTLAIPARLEEEVFDHLRAHPEWVAGFSSVAAEGAGGSASYESAMEKVRGRAARRLVLLVIRRADLDALLGSLRTAFPHPQVAWWITPVLGFGRLA